MSHRVTHVNRASGPSSADKVGPAAIFHRITFEIAHLGTTSFFSILFGHLKIKNLSLVIFINFLIFIWLYKNQKHGIKNLETGPKNVLKFLFTKKIHSFHSKNLKLDQRSQKAHMRKINIPENARLVVEFSHIRDLTFIS